MQKLFLVVFVLTISGSVWANDESPRFMLSPRSASMELILSPFVIPPAYIRICPGKNVTPGLDVSDHEPSTQWSAVRGSGRQFAFIKATEGVDFVSPTFATDWSGSQRNGVIRGAYHFYHPGDDPVVQANFFLKSVGSMNSHDLPAMLDWEVSDGVSARVQIQGVLKWLQIVEAATKKAPILYFSPNFFNSVGNPNGFERYPLFIANYGVSCPAVPPNFKNWVFWQESDTTRIPGVNNPTTDADVFNGTPAQLNAFTSTGALR